MSVRYDAEILLGGLVCLICCHRPPSISLKATQLLARPPQASISFRRHWTAKSVQELNKHSIIWRRDAFACLSQSALSQRLDLCALTRDDD